jgi:hypothetical protein
VSSTDRQPPSAATDPMDLIIEGIMGEDATQKGAARAAFSSIAGAGRPWERLPATFKHAARQDARVLVEAATGPRRAMLIAAGYDARTAGLLLIDTGLVDAGLVADAEPSDISGA